MKARRAARAAVIFNRDFEGADADPENRAREDIKDIADRIVEILEGTGVAAAQIGITDDVVGAMTDLRAWRPTVVYNLCESMRGDNRFESLLPMLLDLEGIPYTGSGPLALALCLHKDRAKEVLRARGVCTPRALCAHRENLGPLRLTFPVIVKPTREDASVGVSSASVAATEEAAVERIRHVLHHYQQPALVEEFIAGREIYVSLLGQPEGPPQALPFFEIDFSDLPPDRPRIVSFEGKWVEDSVEYKGTRPMLCQGLPEPLADRIAAIAQDAFAALDLRDYARFDFRVTDDGQPYIIDVNPNCDLSEFAGGFAKAARAAGIAYPDLVLRILDLAMARRTHADTIPFAPRSTGARGHARPTGYADEPLSQGGGRVRARAPRGGA